jgi:hypothetical protein
LEEQFPGMVFAEDEEEDIEEEEEVFYLWDSLNYLFELYKILKNYNSANYEINSAVMLKLIDVDNLPVKQTIEYIPYIHSGYIKTIQPRTTDNGNGNRENP